MIKFEFNLSLNCRQNAINLRHNSCNKNEIVIMLRSNLWVNRIELVT